MDMIFLKTLLLLSLGMSKMELEPDKPSCSSQGLWIWPISETALPNQQFMLEGYGVDEMVPAKICKTYMPYLQSSDEKVELELIEICEGQHYLTQAVLKPKSPLREGVEYELVVTGLNEYQKVEKWDYKTRQYLPLKWKVSGKADELAPKWTATPYEIGKHYQMFGCGPSLGVKFLVQSNEMQDLRVRTQVRPLGSEKWSSYYLFPADGRISIGRGMCSGEFTLDEAKSFEAKFSLVDPAGNTTEWTESQIQFDRPSEMNE